MNRLNREKGAGGREATAAMRQLFALDVILPDQALNQPYDRDSWHYGSDADQDCRNTRHEVLAAETTAPPEFDSVRQCQVTAGQWTDPWTGATYTDPALVHIDHHVPLKNAHDTGGHGWTDDVKAAFANDLDLDAALNAVAGGTNLAKGARGPDQWQPENTAYHCGYAQDWIAVKHKWQLAVTVDEKQALHEMLRRCP